MHCIFIDLVFLLSCPYTGASGSDDRGNPIPLIDFNKLIYWLISYMKKWQLISLFMLNNREHRRQWIIHPSLFSLLLKIQKNKRILAVHVIRILQFSLIPIDGHHIYWVATPVCSLLKIYSFCALRTQDWGENEKRLYLLHGERLKKQVTQAVVNQP